ncbi:hypothetical protein THRCLA_02696 [Thraustotheca clavata]|uniref:PDZ domain-containing protein n=1 Tax=Thraustotheca clavata TaxID=74557 RepID=A0A1W0A4B9_9STRA|nr:hypothetical protein THRCLA_02696 [Thraustotheca clavata]
MDYTVEWAHGTLGVFVISRPDGKAVVSKLSNPLPDHFLPNTVSIGDVLQQIDCVETTNSFTTTLQMLKSKEPGKTMRLTFTSRQNELPSFTIPNCERHSVEWQSDSPLGLSFAMDPCSLLTIVSKSSHESTEIGDILVAIGPVETTKMRFEQVMETMSVASKPVTLQFVSPILPQDSPLRRKSNLVVEFTGGRLGLAFKIREFPTVTQLLDTSLHDGLKKIQIGDQLVDIDGQSTHLWSMEQVVEKIKSQDATPLKLTFYHPHSVTSPKSTPVQLPPNYYEVIYRGGRLGLILIGKNGNPEIEQVTDPKSAEGLENAVVGDRLVAIDGHRITQMKFDDAIERIKDESLKKNGVRLLFYRPENTSNDDDNFPLSLIFLSAIEALFI